MPARTLKAMLLALLTLVAANCISVPNLSSLGSPSTPTTGTPGKPSHFICWNVHKASDETSTREVEELLSTIPRDDGVILCMQEVRSSTYDLIKNLHRESVSGHYAPSWRLPFSKRSTGVLTIGNQPMPASGAIPIPSPRRELYVASPKVSLSTDVPQEDGRTLQIINCHGLNFVPLSVFPRQLEEIFEKLADESSPAIVCGDFNVWSEERLKHLNDLAARSGLTEAPASGHQHSPAPKWLRGLGRINGFDPDIPLDRIYTRGIEVLDCHSKHGSESSDHLPLVLRYRVKPAS